MIDASRVAGVDRFRGGWLVALLGSRVEWLAASTATEVVAATADCAAVAVDVPIGLSPGPSGRRCDAEARRRLPGAASSVFSPPLRPALYAEDHATAVIVNRAAGGPGLSIQAWNIVPGIREWDDVLRADPVAGQRFLEVHPELSFRAMAAVTGPKSSARGVAERLAALRTWCDPVDALAGVPAGPAIDDALDALACGWTARRWATNVAEVLPPDPPVDDCGLPQRMVV